MEAFRHENEFGTLIWVPSERVQRHLESNTSPLALQGLRMALQRPLSFMLGILALIVLGGSQSAHILEDVVANLQEVATRAQIRLNNPPD
jgi:hypothetical protein